MLRLFQAHISVSDLREMTVGMAEDILIEQANDIAENSDDGERSATQADFDNF
jgi:hypothetical protein